MIDKRASASVLPLTRESAHSVQEEGAEEGGMNHSNDYASHRQCYQGQCDLINQSTCSKIDTTFSYQTVRQVREILLIAKPNESLERAHNSLHGLPTPVSSEGLASYHNKGTGQ